MPSAASAAQAAHDDQHAAAERDAWCYVTKTSPHVLPGPLYRFLVDDLLDSDCPSRSCAHDRVDGATPVLWTIVFPAGGVLLACAVCVARLAELAGDGPAACHLCSRPVAERDAVDAVTARGRVVIDVTLCRRCAAATGLPTVPAPRGGTHP